MRSLDENIHFFRKGVNPEESKSVFNDLYEGLTEDLAEDLIDDLTGNLTGNLTDDLTDDLTGNLIQNSINKLNDRSVKSPAESFNRNPVHTGSSITPGSYFFGDSESTLKEHAWFLENSELETHPVGLKKPNSWGFYDIYTHR